MRLSARSIRAKEGLAETVQIGRLYSKIRKNESFIQVCQLTEAWMFPHGFTPPLPAFPDWEPLAGLGIGEAKAPARWWLKRCKPNEPAPAGVYVELTVC